MNTPQRHAPRRRDPLPWMALALGAAAVVAGCAAPPAPAASPAPTAVQAPTAPAVSSSAAAATPPTPAGDAPAPGAPAPGSAADLIAAVHPSAPDDPTPEVVTMEGTDLVRGKATMVVKAPLEKVRKGVLDFAHYAEFMPHYNKCKLLGKTAAGARDVYMEIGFLHGAIKLWARLEVPPPTVADGVETYESKFVEGNVRELKAVWHLKKLDEGTTQLALEIFLDPKIPIPSRQMNIENLAGAAQGVNAMRKHIEGAATGTPAAAAAPGP